MTYTTIIQPPKIEATRGNRSIIEQFKNVPLEIRRVHWTYDVPGGKDRGGHSLGSICLVLASEVYKEDDYIRDYGEYLEYVNQQQQ